MDYEIKKPKNPGKINVNDMGELLWWSYMLGISPEQLLAMVEEVGNSADAVRTKLR
jgi:hypothetical protein